MDIYTHKHHIIPRHAGGTDDPSNLVELTIEDHAIAHEVRYRIYGDDRDRVAALMIRGQISGYDAFIEMVSRPKSEEWKKARSNAMKGENNPMWGKTTSDAQKDAVGKSAKKRFTGVPKNYKVCNPVMCGKDNPKSRVVLVGDQRYDTVKQAAQAYGVSRVTARRRLTVDTFPDWRYEE